MLEAGGWRLDGLGARLLPPSSSPLCHRCHEHREPVEVESQESWCFSFRGDPTLVRV